MKHLEEFKVAFKGQISRQVVENGVMKKYYRNAFEIGGKTYHVSNAEDISGKAGVVAFVKQGEEKPGGGKVVNDAFTLLYCCDATTAVSALSALDAIK